MEDSKDGYILVHENKEDSFWNDLKARVLLPRMCLMSTVISMHALVSRRDVSAGVSFHLKHKLRIQSSLMIPIN